MRRKKERSEQISGGLMLILIGLGAWAVQVGYMEWREVLAYWPVLILIGGLEKLFVGKVFWGCLTLSVGGLLLVDEWSYFFLHDGWPLLLIAVGVRITWEAVKPKPIGSAEGDRS